MASSVQYHIGLLSSLLAFYYVSKYWHIWSLTIFITIRTSIEWLLFFFLNSVNLNIMGSSLPRTFLSLFSASVNVSLSFVTVSLSFPTQQLYLPVSNKGMFQFDHAMSALLRCALSSCSWALISFLFNFTSHPMLMYLQDITVCLMIFNPLLCFRGNQTVNNTASPAN